MVLFFIFLPVNVSTAPVKCWVPRICSRAPRDWFDGEQAWTESPSLPGTVLLYACCSRVPPHLRLHSPTFPGLHDALWNHPEGDHFPSPRHYLKELMCTSPFVWMKDENCLGGWAWVRPRKGAHSRLCCLHRNHRLSQRLKALHSWGVLGEKGRLHIFWWTQRQHLMGTQQVQQLSGWEAGSVLELWLPSSQSLTRGCAHLFLSTVRNPSSHQDACMRR